MLGSVEYQFPLTANDQFQMVVFTDTGTVENNYTITDYRVSVGTGLRVTVPALGPLPLAFDIAFPVVKGPDDRERLHLLHRCLLLRSRSRASARRDEIETRPGQ